ncbi:MAG TPA: hypothetical protein VFP47_04980 [Pyrinomonadaceae bacterium]|nr:hypothetical protein [Pyrinomonadaceae bacterium]
MKKRLAALVLLLVLFGGAFAGVPLSFGESHCSMGGMMDMNCCKAALLQKQRTKVSEAELLCALDCAQNGTTLPASSLRMNPPAQTIKPPHPMFRQLLATPLSSSVVNTRVNSPPGSPPTYLRNLALLI